MENKTKSKHQGALEQYVEFLLSIQKCNYPFLDKLKEVGDKRDEQNKKDKIDSCLYHSEGVIHNGLLYKKNKIGYRAIWDYDGIEKGTTSFFKRQGGTAYLFKRKDGSCAVVGHGLLWKTRFEKVIKYYDPLAFDPNNLDITNLDTPYKIKKTIPKYKDTFTTDKLDKRINNLVHDEPGEISKDDYVKIISSDIKPKGVTWAEWFADMNKIDGSSSNVSNTIADSKPETVGKPLVGPVKRPVASGDPLSKKEISIVTDVKPKDTEYIPRDRTYNLVNVCKFEKDLELDTTTKEFIPKGTETYVKGNRLVFYVTSNLNARHGFTDAAIRYLFENKYLSSSRQLKPVYEEVIKG